MLASSLWLVKTWQRSAQRYAREREANLLRRQLKKLPLDLGQFLERRSLEDLNPDQLYALAKVLPGFTHQYRLQVYEGVLREAIVQRNTRAIEVPTLARLRQELEIDDEEHWSIVHKLSQDPLLNDSGLDAEQTLVKRSPHQTLKDQTVQRSSKPPAIKLNQTRRM